AISGESCAKALGSCAISEGSSAITGESSASRGSHAITSESSAIALGSSAAQSPVKEAHPRGSHAIHRRKFRNDVKKSRAISGGAISGERLRKGVRKLRNK
ncbi:hypothetical protein ACA29_23465, partial [Lederbergia galactosidilytica]